MDEIRLIELLTKKKSGEISLLEIKEMSDLLEMYPEYQDMLQNIEAFYGTSIYQNNNNDDQFEKRWKSLNQKTISLESQNPTIKSSDKTYSLIYKLIAIAASVVLIIGLGYFFTGNKDKSYDKQNTVLTKPGSKSNLILPDGSKVWLNGDSKISYNENFASGKRELTLTGEAYFDVVKDPQHPFVVKTSSINVTVLGTTFNVKSYEDESNTEATLIRGAVEVTFNKYPGKKILLKPYEKLSVQNIMGKDVNTPKTKSQAITDEPLFTLSKIRKIEQDSGSLETQWVNNKIAFNRKPLSEIAQQLGRWYNVQIEITDERLKDNEYSGVFNNVTLEQVMESLKLTGKFNYKIENNTVRIYH